MKGYLAPGRTNRLGNPVLMLRRRTRQRSAPGIKVELPLEQIHANPNFRVALTEQKLLSIRSFRFNGLEPKLQAEPLVPAQAVIAVV